MAHVPNCICASCGHEMRVLRVGVVAEAVARIGAYYKASADMYGCDLCGARVLVGMARPFARPSDPDYSTSEPSIRFSFVGEEDVRLTGEWGLPGE